MAKKLPKLDSKLYEHELDQKALKTVKATPGLSLVGKKILEFGVERYYKVNYTGSHIKVTSSMFPEVYKLLHECCEVLDIKNVPGLYVEWHYSINGFTIGHENPIIVISSGSLDLLSRAEMSFLLGHELGHIKSGHCLYHMMAQIFPVMGNFMGNVTLGLGNVVSTGIQLALLNWQRMSEFTADRAGLLACQDVWSVVGAFMKLSGVPRKYYGKVGMNEFIEQAKNFQMLDSDNLDKFMKFISILNATHPWTIMRASEILRWVENGDYDNILKIY